MSAVLSRLGGGGRPRGGGRPTAFQAGIGGNGYLNLDVRRIAIITVTDGIDRRITFPMPQPLQQLIDVIRGDTCHDPQWSEILRLAQVHSLIQLLFREAKGSVPSPFKSQLERAFFAEVVRAVILVRELLLIYSMFTHAGIRVLPYKGPLLAQRAYGDPAMRHYVDLDFIIPSGSILQAREMLISAGYREQYPLTGCRAEACLPVGREWVFWHPERSIYLDIKPFMVSRLMSSAKETEELFDRAEEVDIVGHTLKSLSAEDTFICCCLHGVLTRWSPLRQIADAAALIQDADMDWHKVSAISDRHGTTRIVLQAVDLAQALFGTAIPDALGDLLARDRTVHQLTREVIHDINTGQWPCRRTRRWYYKLRSWRGLRYKARFIARQMYTASAQALRPATERGSTTPTATQKPHTLPPDGQA
jgi:hypothetical protein